LGKIDCSAEAETSRFVTIMSGKVPMAIVCCLSNKVEVRNHSFLNSSGKSRLEYVDLWPFLDFSSHPYLEAEWMKEFEEGTGGECNIMARIGRASCSTGEGGFDMSESP
jgi:hypothetical protein